jgi:hypothetical protein
MFYKKSLKISNGNQMSQYEEEQTIQWPKDRRTDNTMAKRQKNRQYNGQKTEEQTIQWPKDRRTDNIMAKRKRTNNDLQNITKIEQHEPH